MPRRPRGTPSYLKGGVANARTDKFIELTLITSKMYICRLVALDAMLRETIQRPLSVRWIVIKYSQNVIWMIDDNTPPNRLVLRWQVSGVVRG